MERRVVAGGSPSVAAEVAGDVSHRGRSGTPCRIGMAVAVLETGGVPERDEREVGQGPGAARGATGWHPAVTHERKEDPTPVVRQRSGADDGGDPRPGGVRHGVA